MPYMDEKDKKIQEQMRQEGKVEIINFNEMVKKYFKSKYNKEGNFEFLYVVYEFYDKDYKVYNLDIGDYVSRPQKRKIKEMLPFFLESNSIDDIRTFSLQIPSVIDVNNLSLEISCRLPKGVTLITDSQIEEILLDNGYEEPYFDHYFYSMMDYPSFNLYAKPTIKNKVIDNQLDENQTGIIDSDNFPQDVPDNVTCEILNDLLLKNQLISRFVKYCIVSENRVIYMTDYFKEYSYNNRKFIRCKSMTSQSENIALSNQNAIDKSEFYWLEVKPIDLSQNKILCTESNINDSAKTM